MDTKCKPTTMLFPYITRGYIKKHPKIRRNFGLKKKRKRARTSTGPLVFKLYGYFISRKVPPVFLASSCMNSKLAPLKPSV